MSILDEYTTRVDATVDATNLLGRLFWYSLSEMRVPHKQFVKLLKDNGILTGHPLAPKDADVFKRVCSNVKRLKVATNDDDIFENFRMTQFRDDTTITRRVVRERVNNAGRKLGFTELFDIVFDRETSDLVFKCLGDFKFRPNTTATSIRDEVTDEYYDWKDCLNSYAVREWMRRYILDLGCTKVKAGVYFVREAHRPAVESMEVIGAALATMAVGDEDISFHSLPLIDDTKQREMIQKAFEAETVDAVDALIAEITDLSKSDRKISADRYAEFLGKYQELTKNTVEYEELLEQKLASTGKRLEIFQASLLNLRKSIKA